MRLYFSLRIVIYYYYFLLYINDHISRLSHFDSIDTYRLAQPRTYLYVLIYNPSYSYLMSRCYRRIRGCHHTSWYLLGSLSFSVYPRSFPSHHRPSLTCQLVYREISSWTSVFRSPPALRWPTTTSSTDLICIPSLVKRPKPYSGFSRCLGKRFPSNGKLSALEAVISTKL